MRRTIRRSALLASVAGVALMMGAPHAGAPDGAGFSFVPSAQAQVSIGINFFYDRLAPHGRWVNHHAHGYVWVPIGVGSGWRPYTQGHWVYTDRWGWYWVADEPFGWATYRYGRWGYHPAYGWYWVPGNVWAPAWVTWRVGDGYMGWAPLGPDRRGYAWGAPRHYRPAVAESWVFVEARYATSRNLWQYVQPIADIGFFLSVADRRSNIYYQDNVFINQPIDIDIINEISVEQIQTVNVNIVDDPDATVDVEGEALNVFQAQIDETEPVETPPDAIEDPADLPERAELDDVLDEVPAEADAPGIAQVEAGEVDPDAELEPEIAPEDAPEAPQEDVPDDAPVDIDPADMPEEPEAPEEPVDEPEAPEEDAPVTDEDPPAEPEEPEEVPEAAPETDEMPDQPEEPEAPDEAEEVPEEAPVTDEVPEEPEAPAEEPEAPAEPEPEPEPEPELEPEPEPEVQPEPPVEPEERPEEAPVTDAVPEAPAAEEAMPVEPAPAEELPAEPEAPAETETVPAPEEPEPELLPEEETQ